MFNSLLSCVMIPDYFHGHLKILIEKSVTVKGQEVHLWNWQWWLCQCLQYAPDNAIVRISAIEFGDQEDVPKVELGEQRVKRFQI